MISFKGKHFIKPIILMVVLWYLAYPLSYRDIEELLLERGLDVDHSTVNRWVVEYSPQLAAVLRKGQHVNSQKQTVFEQFYLLVA